MQRTKIGPQPGRIHRVENLAHLRITRSLGNTEECFQVVSHGASIGPHVGIKVQQRTVLEAEHGQGRTQGVAHGEPHTLCSSSIGHSVKGGAYCCQQACH